MKQYENITIKLVNPTTAVALGLLQSVELCATG
jgi:hypothetical protein